MPRFAILEHDHPVLHWDLLLEQQGSCRTWRLSAPPETCSETQAEALPDHRSLYLDYEGPVSRNRGTVTRWDAGRFDWITSTDDHVTVFITGIRWSGRLELTRAGEGWRAVFSA